jgi:hypothetical protein
MSRRVWISSLALLLVGLAGPVRADVILTVDSTTISPGGAGTVDVWLASTASASSPDQIDNYAFVLQISNNGMDGTQLSFNPNQDFTPVANNSSYLFYNDSFGVSGNVTTSMTGYPNDTFTGSDSTAVGNPVSISTGTSYLLASLTVLTATGSPPIANDSFTISLIPTSGTGSVMGNPAPVTYFDNFDFNNTGTELSATPFTSVSGTETISQGSPVVPEPASIVSGLIGMVVLAGFVGVRRAFVAR